MNEDRNLSMFRKISRTYLFTGLTVLFLGQVFFILNAGIFFNPPLTGSLIVWTHLHTMGVITPFFIGIGWYNLRYRFNIAVSEKHILIHYVLFYGSLLLFLNYISNREGSQQLSGAALGLFSRGYIM